MKFIALACIAFFIHVGQGAPHGNDMKKSDEPMAAAAPASDHTSVPTEPTQPTAPTKADICTANINGTEHTFQPGDRYCVDNTKHRVCHYQGEWIDDSCPEGSICLKSPTSWQVLCRIYVTNAPLPGAPIGENQPNAPSSSTNAEMKEMKPQPQPEVQPQPQPTENKPETSEPQPASMPAPAPTLTDIKPAPSQPETNPAPVAPMPPQTDNKPVSTDNKPASTGSETNSAPVAPMAPTGTDNKPDQPMAADHTSAPTEPTQPTQPTKADICTANINGTEHTFQPGDRYCVDNTKHRVCHYQGEWIDDSCPEGSVCLKSPTSWQILCRIYVRNAPLPGEPVGESQPSASTNTEMKPQPQPTEVKPETSEPAPVPAPVPTDNMPAPMPAAPAPTDNKPAPSQPDTNPAPVAPMPAPTDNKPTSTASETNSAPAAPMTPTGTDNKSEHPTGGAQPIPAALEATTCPGGMNIGDRRCTGEKGLAFQLCDNGGKIVDDKCPDGSVCLNSPTVPQIVCRVYVTSPPQTHPPERR
jgi:hypothetical protein